MTHAARRRVDEPPPPRRVEAADVQMPLARPGTVAPLPLPLPLPPSAASSPSSPSSPRGVLHVVGRLTEAVFHLLGPTTAALAQDRRPQTVLMLDDEAGRSLAARFDASIRVLPVAADGSSVQPWLALGRQLQDLVDTHAWEAVHLHGLIPVVVGLPVVRRAERAGAMIYISPHNSRSLRSLRWLGHPVLMLLKRLLPMHRYQTIANVPFDVRAMKRLARLPARLIESPVDEVFFSVAHQFDRPPPTIVGAAPADATGASERFAQLAVLLADDIPGLRFVWASPAGAREQSLLEAAGVELLPDPLDPYARAHALAECRVFVAPSAGRGFPMALAEAMAVGVASVAADADVHRDMLVHRGSGLIADSTSSLARGVAELLQSDALRRALGDQARQDAMLRFSDVEFRRLVTAAFSRSDGR